MQHGSKKNQWEKMFLWALGLVMCGHSLLAQPFYVDPVAGNDKNIGTITSPFQTLTKAQVSVRAYLSGLGSGMASDLYVYLRGGEYLLPATLQFTQQDGGTNGFHVVYQAYKNERPVITGGRKVTGWQTLPGNKIFVADVPVAGTGTVYPDYFRNIWINGRRAFQARSGFINVYPKPFDATGSSFVYDGLIVKKSAIKNYTNISDLRIFQEGEFKHVEQPVVGINDISDSEKVIMMKQPGFDSWCKTYVCNNQNQVQIVNAREELDAPGEFYLDRVARKLYYYPMPGENLSKASVVVPCVETLVKLLGSAGSKLQGIYFEGISFGYGNWTGPMKLTKEIGRSQADLYSDYSSIEGQFWLNYTQDIRIKQCRFEHFSSSGVYLQTNNSDITIEGNIFRDLTAAAVLVGEKLGVAYNANINQDITVSNNVVRNIGADFFQASGIYANESKNLSIVHNDVADVAYFGINQRYGKSDTDIMSPSAAAFLGNTQIRFNKVTNFGTGFKLAFGVGDEVAGIYFFGVRDSKVQYNYVKSGGKDELMQGVFRQDQFGYRNLWDNNVSECKPVLRSFSYFPDQADSVLFSNCYANVVGAFPKTTSADTMNIHYELNAPAWSAPAQAIINGSGLDSAYQYLLSEVGYGDNLAKQAVVTSSSSFNASYKPSNLVDGLATTAWKPADGNVTNGSWVQLAFAKPIRIDKVQLIPEYKNSNPEIGRYFEVWVSNNANFSAYNILGGYDSIPYPYYQSYQTNSLPVAYNTIDIAGNDTLGYKYVRIMGRSMSWAECRVYGADQPMEATQYGAKSNLSFTPFVPAQVPLVYENWGRKVEDTLDDARVYFGKNAKYWYAFNYLGKATFTVNSDTASMIDGSSTPLFRGAIYRDEAINFKLNITEPSNGEQRITFRAPYFQKAYSNQENYTLRIKKTTGATNTSFQLVRYNKGGGSNTLIGAGGSIGKAVQMNTALYSSFVPVSIATKSSPVGVGILFIVGRDTVVNITDSSANKLDKPGYILFNPGTTKGIIKILDIPVTGIAYTVSDTSISVGQQIQLLPALSPQNATLQKIRYRSSNPTVVTVDASGAIVGASVGTATVTAVTNDGGFVANLLVHVLQPLALSDVSLNADLNAQNLVLHWTVLGDKTVKDCEVRKIEERDVVKIIGNIKAKFPMQVFYAYDGPLPSPGKNCYQVKVNFLDGSSVLSRPLVVEIPAMLSIISVRPNPINGHQLLIYFQKVPEGNYQLKIFDFAGSLLFQKPIIHLGTDKAYPFDLPFVTDKKRQEIIVSVTEENKKKPIFLDKVQVGN